jgi:hypothetical protein
MGGTVAVVWHVLTDETVSTGLEMKLHGKKSGSSRLQKEIDKSKKDEIAKRTNQRSLGSVRQSLNTRRVSTIQPRYLYGTLVRSNSAVHDCIKSCLFMNTTAARLVVPPGNLYNTVSSSMSTDVKEAF